MFTIRTDKLERARVVKGWSRSRLAQIVGIHPSSYLRIVKGEIKNPETIKRIADVLGIEMEELVTEEQTQPAA